MMRVITVTSSFVLQEVKASFYASNYLKNNLFSLGSTNSKMFHSLLLPGNLKQLLNSMLFFAVNS